MAVTNTGTRSNWHLLVVAGAWGAAALLLSIVAQWLVYEKLLNDPGGMRVISPLIAGTVTAVSAFRLRVNDRHNRLSQLRHLKIIADMNHYIRNAMQVISSQAYLSDSEAYGRIRDAMNRIDWALREILPHVIEPEDLSFLRGRTPDAVYGELHRSGGTKISSSNLGRDSSPSAPGPEQNEKKGP